MTKPINPPTPRPKAPPISRDGEPKIIHHMTNTELSAAIERTNNQLTNAKDCSPHMGVLSGHLNFLLEIEAERAAAWRLNAG